MKSGFIAIVGRPNVGKSTLLNAILGAKVAITSEKPQTTRNTIRGIYTKDDLQLVFLDTPGIHKGKNKLGQTMSRNALATLNQVDLIIFMTDDSIEKGPGDKYIIEELKKVKTPKFLAINKIDILGPAKYEEIFHEFDSLGVFDEIFGISAAQNRNIEPLIEEIAKRMEEGPFFFPEDMHTDHPERFIVAEIIREKLLMYLDQEVPHGVAVAIDQFKERKNCIDIYATIFCERKSHKGIIIGKQGRKLKGVGKSAREDIEALLGTKVYLELWVKVKENWRDSDFMLNNLGYKEE